MTDREVVTGSSSRRGRVRDFVSNRPNPQKLGVLGAALVLVTAPFGGLQSVAEEKTQPLELGQRIDIGPFYVTLEKVTQVSDLEPAVSPDEEGTKLVVLKVVVVNHSDRAEFSNLVRDAIGADHSGLVPWETNQGIPLKVFNFDDATAYNEYINPGQTYTLALVFQQDPGTDLDLVTFAVHGYSFREVDPGTLEPNTWILDSPPLAEGHVPIEVKP